MLEYYVIGIVLLLTLIVMTVCSMGVLNAYALKKVRSEIGYVHDSVRDTRGVVISVGSSLSHLTADLEPLIVSHKKEEVSVEVDAKAYDEGFRAGLKTATRNECHHVSGWVIDDVEPPKQDLKSYMEPLIDEAMRSRVGREVFLEAFASALAGDLTAEEADAWAEEAKERLGGWPYMNFFGDDEKDPPTIDKLGTIEYIDVGDASPEEATEIVRERVEKLKEAEGE